jgi:hypothetical protein
VVQFSGSTIFLPVSINNRYVVTPYRGDGEDLIAIIFGPDFERRPGLRAKVVQSGRFQALRGEDSEKVPFFLMVESAEDVLRNEELRLGWLEAARSELDRARSSPYRRFHVPVYHRLAVDSAYRQSVLDKVFPPVPVPERTSRTRGDSHKVQPVDSEAFGTADDYFRALQAVLKEHVPPKHLDMLREHFNAPDHTTTWKQLAQKVGYPDFNTVSLQYGTFAGRVAGQLGLSEKPLDPNGNGWWLWVLVHWADERDASGDTAFVLRPEVVKALERIEHSRLSAVATQPRMNFYIQYHNYEKMAGFPNDPDAFLARRGGIYTRVATVEQSKGGTVFLIVGIGKPRRYYLWETFTVEDVEEEAGNFQASGPGWMLMPPQRLQGPDFEVFRAACANFVCFRSIDGLPYLADLQQLADRYHLTEVNQDCEGFCTELIGLLPDDGDGYYYRGFVRHRLGNRDGAREDFRKALELETSFPEEAEALLTAMSGQGSR